MARKLILALVISLPLGFFVGGQLNQFLAISISEKELPNTSFEENDETERPPLSWRMVDIGGVGIEPDTSIWGKDYAHNTHRYKAAILNQAPFIDSTVFNKYYQQFQTYIDRMADLGFNAIELSGFLGYVDFDKVGNGFEIYPEHSIYRQRQAAFRKYFGLFFDYAKTQGLKVILKTDMVALTTPLEDYIKKKVGSLDVESEAFWQVYQKGLEELFERFPQTDGLMIRIGEAGSVYNRPGWDYRSRLLVRSVQSVQMMLRAFLDVAEAYDKTIVFRTWSVGVGEVGNIHTSPSKYARVLDTIDSENLIVTTKFTKGDFWNHLPLNPTLFSGKHKRIIEMQARREFEAFNVIPNYVAPLHNAALNTFLQSNANITGFWVWTQSGGPLRRGPMMLYPFHGFWLWTDANVYATAQIAQNPGRSIKAITEDWVKKMFGDDPEVVAAMTQILLDSHETAANGLTIPAFANKQVNGLGLEVPPVIYSYWDIVGTSTSINSHVYFTAKNDFKTAVSEILEPAARVREMKELARSITDKVEKGKEWLPNILKSLEYEENLFDLMAVHKRFLLYFYAWLDTGREDYQRKWEKSASEYRTKKIAHYSKYLGNLDFPAYNFDFADRGVSQAQKTEEAIWLARILIFFMLIGPFFYTLKKGWFPKNLILVLTAIIVVCVLATVSSFSAPSFSLLFAFIAIFYFAAIHLYFSSYKPMILPLTGLPILVFALFVIGAIAIRGPFYFWYNFWINEGFRTWFSMTFVFAILGHFICLICTFRKPTIFSQAGKLLIAISLPLFVMAFVFLLVGFEETLSVLNDELLLLPGMMSRILGITTHLNIPADSPFYLLGVAMALFLSGILLISKNRHPVSR